MKKFYLVLLSLFFFFSFSGCDFIINVLEIGPDFVVDSINISKPDADSKLIESMNIVFENQGVTNEADIPYSVYLSSDTTIDSNDQLIYSEQVDILKGDKTQVDIGAAGLYDYFTNNSVILPAKTNYIGVIIDPDGYYDETEEQNNIGVSDTLLFLPGLDSFEPDDSIGAATVIAVGADVESHYFYPEGDVDLYRFSATVGTTYSITTSPIDPDYTTDTYIEVLDDAGDLIDGIGTNSFGVEYAVYAFTPEYTGTFYVKVFSETGSTGVYGFRITTP